MKKDRIITVLPLIILIGTLLYSAFTVFTSNIILDTPHWIAIALILLNMIVLYFNNRAATLLTGLILLAGSFNLLYFTPIIFRYDIGFSVSNPILGKIGIDSLSLQSYSIAVLVLYLLLNWKFLKANFVRKIA